MSQLSYELNMEVGQAGLKADTGFDNVLTYRAFEPVRFGLGVVQGVEDRDARLPSLNVAELTFDADFVTDNEIDLDVNGESITTVVFDSDHATTLANLADEIDGLAGISASVTGTREITIIAEEGPVLVENVAVTEGASQADSEVVYLSNHVFVGVALKTHAAEQDLEGLALYKEGDAMSVLTKGRVYVTVETDVEVNDPVYLRAADGEDEDEKRGGFRNDDDEGDAFLLERVRWVKGASEGGLAVLEINLP